MAAPQGIILKADAIAAPFQRELQAALSSPNLTRKPRLVGILSTSSAPSKSYAEFTRRSAEALGVDFVIKRVGAALLEEGESPDTEGKAEGDGVEEAIIEANADDSVDGIMVYYPIFGGRQDHYLQQIVSPFKDVEGLHFKFHYNLYHNIRFIRPQSLLSSIPEPFHSGDKDVAPPGTIKSILPCTPLAIVKCLEHSGVYNLILPYGDRAYGKTVTVINRSEVVGRPLAALLSNDGARVFSVDIDSIQEYTKRPSPKSEPDAQKRYHPHHVVRPCTLSLQECLAVSDVVVTAVPDPKYKVKTEWLKDGCICVNVASEKNFEKDVRDKASLYIAAVGKVTIMMLLRNLLRLTQYQDMLKSDASGVA